MASIQSWFHQTIKRLKLTETAVSKETIEDLRARSVIRLQEQVLGIYRNQPPGAPIVFTDEALIIQEGASFRCIPYVHIESSAIDSGRPKELMAEILLKCKLKLQTGSKICSLHKVLKSFSFKVPNF